VARKLAAALVQVRDGEDPEDFRTILDDVSTVLSSNDVKAIGISDVSEFEGFVERLAGSGYSDLAKLAVVGNLDDDALVVSKREFDHVREIVLSAVVSGSAIPTADSERILDLIDKIERSPSWE